MNYLELINQYWDLREQGILTANEGDYYLFLIHKCNRLNWKNPFNLSNQLCCGYLGVQEKSLIKYRNKLKQVELIDFKSGTKGCNTEYTIHFPKGCNFYSQSGNHSGSLSGSESGSLSGGKPPDNIKPILNSTKQNREREAPPQNPASEPKKMEQPNPPPVPEPPQRNESQFPKADSDMTLEDWEIGGAIEYVRRIKKTIFTNAQIEELFEAFKIQFFNGKKFYQDKSDVLKHFRDWVKFQKVDTNTQKSYEKNKGNSAKVSGTVDYAGGV